MATRVNTRFVAILLVVLLVLAGGVGVAAMYALKKTGQQHAALGDQRVKEGDYEQAIGHYSKAVYKDQSNAEWCAKWVDALEHTTPTPRQAYADRFFTDYTMALRGLADAQPTDVKSQRRYLDMRFRHVQRAGSMDLQAWEAMVGLVDDALERFRDNPDEAATLRRYRGLSLVAIYRVVGMAQRPKEEVAQARADLAAAIAADPTDDESALGMVTWLLLTAQQTRTDDAPRANELTGQARALLQGLMRDHPPASRAALALVQLEVAETIRVSTTGTRYATALAQHTEQLRGVAEALKAEPPEKLDAVTVAITGSYLAAAPQLGTAAAREVIESAIARRPKDPLLLMALGRVQVGEGKHEEALATFQKVFDLPDPPLSLDGMALFAQRAEAVKWQVQTRLAQWDTAKGAPDRQAALKGAEEYRGALARYLGESETAMLLIDAKLDVARGDVPGARTKLDRYNQLTNNNDSEAMILLAEIMAREGNLGASRDLYLKMLGREPTNIRVLKLVAGVEGRLRDFKAAAEHYNAILAIEPGNQEATAQLKIMNDLALGAESPDVLVRTLARAQEHATGVSPDYEAASAVVREAIAGGNHDPRLYLALARLRMLTEDATGAGEVIDQGLARHADDAQLKDFKKMLGSGDPLENIERVVEASDATPLNKNLLLFLAYQRAGKLDKAKAALAKAAELDKNSPAVLEFQFQLALAERDLPQARRVADAATAADADHLKGQWFRARMEIAENKLDAGAGMLEQIAAEDKLNVEIWRLLGSTRLLMGQSRGAAEAFEKALEIRTTDLPSVVGYMRAKGGLKEYDAGLAMARKHKDTAAWNAEFVDVWLALESLAGGGDKNKALEVRLQLARRSPKDERNNAALAALLMDQKRWGEAKAVIDALMAVRVDADFVDLLAKWHAAQGDAAGARAAVDGFVGGLPPDKQKGTDKPYILLAQTLVGFNQYQGALSAMEEARKRQDKTEMDADRSLGDMMFSLEQFDRALEAYLRVADAKVPDAGNRVVKRILECDLRLGRYDDARRRLEALGALVESDNVLLLTKAELLAATGNRPEARTYFDRAVAGAKADPQGYIRRADFLSREIETLADAEGDLRQAIKLDPRSQPARQRLASLCASAGRWSDTVATLREGLVIDPDNDALRLMLVAVHLDRKEVNEAVAVIELALQRRPDDVNWLRHGARVTAISERWAQTVSYGERVWQLSRTPDAAMMYVDALLRSEPPQAAKAMAVMEAPELKVAESLPLLLTRARVHYKLNRTAEAARDSLAALTLAKDNPMMVDSFFGGMEVLFPDPSLRLRAVMNLNPPEGFTGWRGAFMSALKGVVPETKEEGLSELKQIAESGAVPDMRRFAYTTLGTYAHQDKKSEEALMYWRKGLELDPNDPELNNNIGYVLASRLHKPAEARPFAEKAAQAAPTNPAILDTLGTVYLALNELPRAEMVLLRAISVAKGPQLPALFLRLGQLRAAQGNKKDAERYLRLLDDAAANDASVKSEYGGDADELRRKIATM